MRPWHRPRLALLLVLAALVQFVVPAVPAQAQVGMPVDLGSAEADSTNVLTLSMTSAAAVPVGASIIVVAVNQVPGASPPPPLVAPTAQGTCTRSTRT
jgi:hypothetical protein